MSLEAKARLWLGTPFVLGAAERGRGCDCLGLLRGTLGFEVSPYGANWLLTHGTEALVSGLRAQFATASGPLQADQILLFALRPRGPSCHIGIASQGGEAFIHAYAGRGVVESPLSAAWLKRLRGRYVLGE